MKKKTVKAIEKYTTDYHAELIELLKDPDEALTYLQVALDEYDEDRDYEAFMIALRNVAEAKGGINKLAERTHLNRQNLYRVLSKTGNPRFDTLCNIIHSLGFKLSVSKLSKVI